MLRGLLVNVNRTTRMIVAAAVGSLACLALVGAAQAGSDYVTLRFAGDDLARLGYVKYGSRTFLAEVGQSDFYVSGAHAGLGDVIAQDAPDNRTTGYCIEVLKSIQLGGSYQFTVEDLSLAPTLVDPSRAADLLKLFSMDASKVVDDDTAAAFQAAVWEIVNEPNPKNGAQVQYDVDRGLFTVTPVFGQTWDGIANGWLTGLGSDTPTVSAYALVSAKTQDFAWLMPAITTEAKPAREDPVVPEPLTIVSGFLAVSAVGFYVRRRTRALAQA
jgi:hypothetical protein